MPHLVITGSDGKRSTRRLEPGQSLTVGRSSRNALHQLELTDAESRYTSMEREGARAHEPARRRAFAS